MLSSRERNAVGPLEEWSRSLSEQLRVDLLWCISVVLSVLGCAAPYCLIDTDELSDSSTRLNLIFENLSRSGIGKSRPLNEWARPVLKMMKEGIGKDLIVSSSYSPEGMVTQYHETIEVPKHADPLRDYTEFGGLMHIEEGSRFHRAVSKDTGYASEGAEFISMIYDGWLEPRSTNHMRHQEGRPVFINVVLTSTSRIVFRIWNKNDSGESPVRTRDGQQGAI